MTVSMISIIILTISALAASIVSGMTGMAGGTILLAIMAMLLETELVVPLHASVQLVSNSTRLALFFRHIKWRIVLLFLLGIVPGAVVGINIFQMLDKDIVKLLMGLFILSITLMPKSKKERTVSYKIFIPVGFVSGFIGVFFGAIGPFIAPFFIRKDVIKEELVATKATCQAVTHVIKIILFGYIGLDILGSWRILIPLCVAVLIGTFVGKKCLSKISDSLFKKVFKVLLILISLRIIIMQVIKLIA